MRVAGVVAQQGLADADLDAFDRGAGDADALGEHVALVEGLGGLLLVAAVAHDHGEVVPGVDGGLAGLVHRAQGAPGEHEVLGGEVERFDVVVVVPGGEGVELAGEPVVAAAADGGVGLVEGGGDLGDGPLVDLALEDEQPCLGPSLRGGRVVGDGGGPVDGFGYPPQPHQRAQASIFLDIITRRCGLPPWRHSTILPPRSGYI